MDDGYVSYVNEDYEFKFTVAQGKNKVVLRDDEGFIFLSVNLVNKHAKLLDKDVAYRLLEKIKPVIEEELHEAQKLWKSQKQDSAFALQRKLFAYIERLEDLEKQLTEATDELDIILIEAQIKKLGELIIDARSQVGI